jgi:hypothetical protein
MDKPRATLTTIAGGQAVVLFNRELETVLENIADPRTKPDVVRKITLTVVFRPDEERHATDVRIECTSSLPKHYGAKGLAYIGINDGEVGIFNSDPKQLSLADELAAAQERKVGNGS